MKVSIIVPIYNAEKTLHITLDSIIQNQPNVEFEVLCINDGSTDNTLKILNKYSDKYEFFKIYSKENGGEASARNYGLDLATGAYIFFIDADDYITGNMYEEMYHFAVKNDLDVVISDYYNIEGEIVKSKLNNGQFITNDNKTEFLFAMNTDLIVPFTWRNGYRLQFINDHKLRFNETLKYGVDSLFNSYCYLLGNNIKHIGNAYYHYLFTSEGIMGAPKNDYLQYLEKLYVGKMIAYDVVNQPVYKHDLYVYTLTHTIGLLFCELVRTNKSLLKSQIKMINQSNMFKESFQKNDTPVRKLHQTKAIRVFTWMSKHNLVSLQILFILLTKYKYKKY